MRAKPRRRKSLRKKIAAYVSLLIILGFAGFFLNKYYINRNPNIVSPLAPNDVNISTVKKQLSDKKISYEKAEVLGDSSYIINIKENGQVRLSGAKDISEQVSSLQRILRELTIEGKSFKTIDFRFDKPIISF